MKNVIIVHRWGAQPESDWYLWLKQELEKKKVKVQVLKMPDTEAPDLESWVSTLTKAAKEPTNTIFIGHSIGCQTIMRYAQEHTIRGAVFVAGWFDLEGLETDEEKEIAAPWIETPIDLSAVKMNIKRSTAFFSDDDPYVPISNAEKFKKLGCAIIFEKDYGHFTEDDGYKKLPAVLAEVLKIL